MGGYCAREAAVADVAPLCGLVGDCESVGECLAYRTHCVGDDLDLEVGHFVVV